MTASQYDTQKNLFSYTHDKVMYEVRACARACRFEAASNYDCSSGCQQQTCDAFARDDNEGSLRIEN